MGFTTNVSDGRTALCLFSIPPHSLPVHRIRGFWFWMSGKAWRASISWLSAFWVWLRSVLLSFESYSFTDSNVENHLIAPQLWFKAGFKHIYFIIFLSCSLVETFRSSDIKGGVLFFIHIVIQVQIKYPNGCISERTSLQCNQTQQRHFNLYWLAAIQTNSYSNQI